MQFISKYSPWLGMFLILAVLFMVIHKRFQEKKVFASVVKKYRGKKEEKIKAEKDFVSSYGNIENRSLIFKFDRLILTSGIKRFIPCMDGEKYLFIMIFSAIAGLITLFVATNNIYIALFVGALIAVVLYALVLAFYAKTYNRIEDDTSIFVAILANHAKSSSDLMTIMQNTCSAIDGPIRSLLEQFLINAEKTADVDIALDVMRQSIDNRQLQTIIVNLKNCMHYQANYEEVISQMMSQIAASLSAREDRKNILFSMKLTLIIISIASFIIVELIGKGLGIEVIPILKGNSIGQFLMFLTGVMYLFVVTKLFGTDK